MKTLKNINFKNGLTWIGIVTICTCVFVFFYEYQLIPQNQKLNYIVGKTIAVLCISICSLGLIIVPENKRWQIGYSFFSYFYFIHGNFFRADYEMAYFQFLFPQSIYFNYSKKLFWRIHLSGTMIFIVSLWINYADNLSRKAVSENLLDSISILLVNLAIGIIVFSKLETAEKESKLFKEKLLLVGNQAANLIHDLKSLSSAPQIYLDILLSNQNKIPQELRHLLVNLHNDLNRMTNKTKQIYSLIQNNTGLTSEPISQSIIKVQSILQERISNVSVTIECQTEKLFPAGLFELILLNLFYNSLQAFQNNQTEDPSIHIFADEHNFKYHDNAGGISSDIIYRFNNFECIPSSGLGLYLIKETAKSHDIEVRISETPNNPGTEFVFEI